MSQIRNILQTVQEREVVKQAPDVEVYIDGLNYMTNPFLGGDGVNIPFNDYLSSFNASYSIDGMVPSASITLTVPIHMDHLFRSPGGNNLFRTMSDVRVFMKGRFLSAQGNTVYHQVFKGYISAINYTTSGSQTLISLSCVGAMGLLEKMQIDLAPSLQTSTQTQVQEFTSTNHNWNPYEMLAWAFIYPSMLDSFEVISLKQAVLDASNPYYGAIEQAFVTKWQGLLADMARDVHIFGVNDVTDLIQDIAANTKQADERNEPISKDTAATARDKKGPKPESENVADNASYFEQMRKYLPEQSIGTIQLFNGRFTNRLERVRFASSIIGLEAYQDVDGGIVIKPPMYNLDVRNLAPATQSGESVVDNITTEQNPFVLNQKEILSENETEDEAAVRLTRILVQGGINVGGIQFSGTEEITGTVEDVDVAKLARYGLRTEPTHTCPWFHDDDKKAMFAFATNELTRANSAFRTYSVVTGARPELKLGFPLYLPHRDMYGYIQGISLNYSKGATATTEIQLSALRRKPMYPVTQDIPDPVTKKSVKKTILTPAPNLIQKWTRVATTSGKNPEGKTQLTTLPVPKGVITDQHIEKAKYDRQKLGTYYGVEPDTTEHCWRVQMDDGSGAGGKTYFNSTTPIRVDADYYDKLTKARPYTDGEGYELVGVFPWGRWVPLKQALYDFTVKSPFAGVSIGASKIQPVEQGVQQVTAAQAFLFTGENVPTTASTVPQMTSLSTTVTGGKVFEVVYTPTADASGTLRDATSPMLADAQATAAKTAMEKAAVFVSGTLRNQQAQAKAVMAAMKAKLAAATKQKGN